MEGLALAMVTDENHSLDKLNEAITVIHGKSVNDEHFERDSNDKILAEVSDHGLFQLVDMLATTHKVLDHAQAEVKPQAVLTELLLDKLDNLVSAISEKVVLL